MSEFEAVRSCKSDGSRPHRLKKRSSSVPALEKRSLRSDLERVREGLFLVLEEDRRVMAGEGGGNSVPSGGAAGRAGGHCRGAGEDFGGGVGGAFSGFEGVATTGLRGEGLEVVLR